MLKLIDTKNAQYNEKSKEKTAGEKNSIEDYDRRLLSQPSGRQRLTFIPNNGVSSSASSSSPSLSLSDHGTPTAVLDSTSSSSNDLSSPSWMGCPKSSMPSLCWRRRQMRHMMRRVACIVPATANVIQLVQSVSGLNAMLRTIAIAPGLCMHIIGILNAPTNFEWYVRAIWGMYWMAASMADETPRKVAHIDTSGVRGSWGGGLVVPSSRSVTKRRRKKWIATTEESVMERRQSSLRIVVLTCCGGRDCCVETAISAYLR